jgi:translation initiation factor 1 (eIF-1/SUI1)
MHQCYKQNIKRLSPTEDCCIFRVNTIRHEESTNARNKTSQEHYGRKMTMFLGCTTKLYDPKNLTSNLQEFEGINMYFSHKSN